MQKTTETGVPQGRFTDTKFITLRRGEQISLGGTASATELEYQFSKAPARFEEITPKPGGSDEVPPCPDLLHKHDRQRPYADVVTPRKVGRR
ncbi:hypothetical protein [Actinomadura macra]|uniref:hypothetical protein n=1 Tax=Actinomadura macra TaxID=46164 RepID=UPI0012FB065D|nr:hypothetical protein [Actinomadura macra]